MRLARLRLAFDKIHGYDNTDLNNHLWNWIKEHASEIAELSNSGGTGCYTSEAVQVCGSWVKCDKELPPDNENYMYLADYDGELFECFGHYDKQNRIWHDLSNIDSDGVPEEVYTAKYWLKLDSKPEV